MYWLHLRKLISIFLFFQALKSTKQLIEISNEKNLMEKEKYDKEKVEKERVSVYEQERIQIMKEAAAV